MIVCQKRQRMITNGKEEYRCIHKDSNLYGQIVDTICEECPLNRPKKNWDKQCGRCASREIINDKISYCKMYNKIVTLQECKICLTKSINDYEKETGILKNDMILKNDKKYPSLTTQVNNYRLAITRWIKAGRPKRSDEDIKIIYEKYCKQCNWYDKKSKRCKGCGCRVVPKGLALTNKLKMATEHCPKNLF